MASVPTGRLVVAKVAVSWPPLVDSVSWPSTVEPFLNVTWPVGTPAPGAVTATVAVKVTDWPIFDGLTEEIRLVVVAALATVWVSVVDVDGALLASPP